jgi:hypothetical protein
VLKAHETAELLAAYALAPKRIAIAAAIKGALAMPTALPPAIDPLAVALRRGTCRIRSLASNLIGGQATRNLLIRSRYQ